MGVWRVTYKPPLQLDGVLVDAGAVGAAPVQMPDGWPWAPVAGLQTAGMGNRGSAPFAKITCTYQRVPIHTLSNDTLNQVAAYAIAGARQYSVS